MGDWIELEAEDGHRFKAWRAKPSGAVRGGLVLLQEIYGVNGYIRAQVDAFGAEGYDTVAPALFDRVERDVALDYGPEGTARGRGLRDRIPAADAVRDMAAARDAVAGVARIGAVGYCWGGMLAWLCATRLRFDCAVGYYGSMTIDFVGETPNCPVTLMLGERDATFPPEAIAAIRKAHPRVVVFTYPAGHGFACDRRDDFHEPSARLARERTLDILQRYLAG